MQNSKITVPYLNEKLLHVEEHRNLAKNYAILKNRNHAVYDEKINKCEIINQSEVSAAFDIYLQRIRSAVKINNHASTNEKMLNFCDKILKVDTLHRKNDNARCDTLKDGNANNVVGNDVHLASKIMNKEIVISADSTTNNSIINANLNNNVTVDDFLIKQDGKKDKLKSNSTQQNICHKIASQVDGEYEKDEFFHNSNEFSYNSKDIHEHHKKKVVGLSIRKTSMIHSNDDSKEDTTNNDSKGQKAENPPPTSDRPYVCPKCKMSFKRNLHLKRHFIVTHTVNKNFKCETCSKMFSRKDYLDKHVSGHQKKSFKMKLLRQGIVVRTKMFSKSNK